MAVQGKQTSTIHIAKLLQGEDPTFDVTGLFASSSDDPERDETIRQLQVTAAEGLKQVFAPILIAIAAYKEKQTQVIAAD